MEKKQEHQYGIGNEENKCMENDLKNKILVAYDNFAQARQVRCIVFFFLIYTILSI